MRDFLRLQFALLIGIAIALPGTAVAIALAAAMHQDILSLLVFVSAAVSAAWLARRVLRRFRLSGEDFEIESREGEGFGWLVRISTVIVLGVSAVAAILLFRHFDGLFPALKPRVGEDRALVLAVAAAIALWLYLAITMLWGLNILTGRIAFKPRPPDFRGPR